MNTTTSENFLNVSSENFSISKEYKRLSERSNEADSPSHDEPDETWFKPHFVSENAGVRCCSDVAIIIWFAASERIFSPDSNLNSYFYMVPRGLIDIFTRSFQNNIT